MSYLRHVGRGFGSAWQGILFRRTIDELKDVIRKTQEWIPQIWPEAIYNKTEKSWTWPSGETLFLRHFYKAEDYWSYHGWELPWIGWEELTTWPDLEGYTRMMSTSRTSKAGVPRMVRATTNPYGPGHNVVKDRFRLPVLSGKLMNPVITDSLDLEGNPEPHRVAINSSLKENKVMLHNDPTYIDRLRASASSQAQLDAWLYGSWDIVAGGMFDDVWNRDYNVIPAFDIPRSWYIDRAYDWGSSSPFSVGWWAESDGTDVQLPNGKWRSTVRGDLYLIHEWYGWTGRANVGQRLLDTEIAQGIIERELQYGLYGRVHPGPADTNIWNIENGDSPEKRMRKPVRINGRTYPGPTFIKADKRAGSRVMGWQAMREMIKHTQPEKPGMPREKPGLFVFSHCDQFLRTVPVAARDPKKIEDIDTDSEDHVCDMTRYRVRKSGTGVSTGTTIGLT